MKDTYGPFITDASKNLVEISVADGEGDAPGDETSECKNEERVLPDSAAGARGGGEPQPDDTEGVTTSWVIVDREGATVDPMPQEQGDDALDDSDGATGGGVQAENSEKVGASGMDAGKQAGDNSDTEASCGKRPIAQQGPGDLLRGVSDPLPRGVSDASAEGMQSDRSDHVDAGAKIADGKDQIKRRISGAGKHAFPSKGDKVLLFDRPRVKHLLEETIGPGGGLTAFPRCIIATKSTTTHTSVRRMLVSRVSANTPSGRSEYFAQLSRNATSKSYTPFGRDITTLTHTHHLYN